VIGRAGAAAALRCVRARLAVRETAGVVAGEAGRRPAEEIGAAGLHVRLAALHVRVAAIGAARARTIAGTGVDGDIDAGLLCRIAVLRARAVAIACAGRGAGAAEAADPASAVDRAAAWEAGGHAALPAGTAGAGGARRILGARARARAPSTSGALGVAEHVFGALGVGGAGGCAGCGRAGAGARSAAVGGLRASRTVRGAAELIRGTDPGGALSRAIAGAAVVAP
jgi:hypothetical protein